MGVMSPTKLRMKLLGSHGHGGGKKDEASGNSSRASPSRLDDVEGDDHPKNSLLAQELDEGSFFRRVESRNQLHFARFSLVYIDWKFRSSEYPKDRSDSSRPRSDASHGRAAAHSGGGSGGDSGHENGGAGGNFEFQREVRAAAAGPFFRPVPSKWNDAEKWIAGRHVVHSNPIFSKKPAAAPPHAAAAKGGAASCDSNNPSSRGRSAVTELSSKSSSPSSVRSPAAASRPPPQKKLRAAAPCTVSMRDVGTEMTPIASQEQSRSGTPAGAATPSLSPLCSVPCSPRCVGSSASGSSSFSASERDQELRLRTRREIAALGLQLGKMNIASWASKEEGLLAQAAEAAACVPGAINDEIKTKEFEARAAAWEESRKCKLAARCVKN